MSATLPAVEPAPLKRLAEHLHAAVDALVEILEPAQQQPDRALRFSEVAERLGCDRSHVGRLGRAGHLELVYLGKASPRVKASSLDRLMARGGVHSVRWARRRRNSLLAEIGIR